MEIKTIENKSDQVFYCIKKFIKNNGYIILEDDFWGNVYKIYKKHTLFKSFKKPIIYFEYGNCTMYINIYNKSQYNNFINIIKPMLENIEDLTIQIEKHYKDCK